MQLQKQQNDLGSFSRHTIQHHSNPSLCPTTDAQEAETDWFYEDLQDLLEVISKKKKDDHFIIGDWNEKVGSQEIPGIKGKFGLGIQNKAGQKLTVLSTEYTGHSKHPLLTIQEMTLHVDITKSVQSLSHVQLFVTT